MNIKEIIHNYFQAWVDHGAATARSYLVPSLKFKAPSDEFDNADDFIETCWKFAEDFNYINYVQEVYSDDCCYVVYKSKDLCSGELIKLKDDKITEIYVTFNPTC